MAVGPRKFCNLVLAWCYGLFNDLEKRRDWEMELDAPLPWEINAAPSRAQLQQEARDFLSTMKSLTA